MPLLPQGFSRFVGQSILLVPARNGNRTTNVELNYTFTQADANAGKVTFRATAELPGDQSPADNTAISTPPTRVSDGKAAGNGVAATSVGETEDGISRIFLPTLQASQ